MKMLVLGAGLQGRAVAYDLLRQDDVDEVVLGDLSIGTLPPFLEREVGGRLRAVEVDARNHVAVGGLMDGAATVLSALPYDHNVEMTRLAMEAGSHFCDLGGNTEIVRAQSQLDEDAGAAGVLAVPDCGLAPGSANVLAAAGMEALDRTDAVRIRVGGLPEHPEPPLGYQIVYSLDVVLDLYTTDAVILRDGEIARAEGLTGVETTEFEGVGELEAFFTGGGTSLMPWRFRGEVRELDYKTFRYPGHARAMRTVRDLGLLSRDPVRVGEVDVIPREVFKACVEPVLEKPGSPDLVALRVVVEGDRGGSPCRIVYELLDRRDPETGITAMERTTGFGLSIVGLMLARGEIGEKGVRTPDRCVPAEPYLEALSRRGIEVRRATSGDPAPPSG